MKARLVLFKIYKKLITQYDTTNMFIERNYR